MNEIIYKVAHLYGVLPQDITSRNRGRIFSDARAVCCYILLRKKLRSLHDVGNALNITHASVLYNVKRVQDWIDDPRINPHASEIIKRISQN